MKSTFIKQVSRPDGYFGKRANVWLVFDHETGKTLEVYPSGFHNSHVPQEVGALEAEWILNNHPTCTDFYSKAKI